MENSLLSLRKSSNGRFSTSMSVYHCFHFIYGIFPGGFPRWFSPGAQRRCSGSSRGSLELCWKPTHHGFISGIYMAFTTDFLWFTLDFLWFAQKIFGNWVYHFPQCCIVFPHVQMSYVDIIGSKLTFWEDAAHQNDEDDPVPVVFHTGA